MATVKALVVGGGGGGGGAMGGGGGAGQFRYIPALPIPEGAHPVTVGGGGGGGVGTSSKGTNGASSKVRDINSIGGGAGGHYNAKTGEAGASGGGGGAPLALGGQALAGFGGGKGNSTSFYTGAGGGGAGGVGVDGGTTGGGNGGVGLPSEITGTQKHYAGGGGGGGYHGGGASGPSEGGLGGGGAGIALKDSTGAAGTPNTGGGGGGGGYLRGNGGVGGSGVVILSYATDGSDGISPASTGGVKTASGDQTIHTFAVSGTFVPVLRVAPEATTQAVSAIVGGTAVFSGTVAQIHDGDASEVGFYYKVGSSGDPTSMDSVASSTGTFGLGAFLENVSGLIQGAEYRVAAFVVNPGGVSVGSTVGFATSATPTVATSPASEIGFNSAVLNGAIAATGADSLIEAGFYYLKGSFGDPTASDIVVSRPGAFPVGPLAEAISGLSPGTAYRVAAFARNSRGVGVGPTVDLTTPILPATVATKVMSNVSEKHATLNAELTDSFGGNVTRIGFYYMKGTAGVPTDSDSVVSKPGDFGEGMYALSVSELKAETSYRFVAFVERDGNTFVATEAITLVTAPAQAIDFLMAF